MTTIISQKKQTNNQSALNTIVAGIAGVAAIAGVAVAATIALKDKKSREKVKKALKNIKDQVQNYTDSLVSEHSKPSGEMKTVKSNKPKMVPKKTKKITKRKEVK